MNDRSPERSDRPGIERRTLIKRAAAIGAVAWTTPIIVDSLASPAAAATVAPPVVFNDPSLNGSDGQAFIVEAGVEKLIIDVIGAKGGDGQGTNSQGAFGGKSSVTILVTPGETIHVFVGGKGANHIAGTGGVGGINGGGTGGNDNNASSFAGGGGGGASDARQGGSALTNRVVVGGGGGGGGGASSNATQGGAGGGTAGDDGHNAAGQANPGLGGTQAGGGNGGVGVGGANGGNGTLGIGGDGAIGSGAGGGGGGGYYGGGGAGAKGGFSGAGGGGGSGFGTAMTNGIDAGNSGNGTVTITALS